MKKNGIPVGDTPFDPEDLDIDMEDMDDADQEMDEVVGVAPVTAEEARKMSIVEALDEVQERAHRSGLSDEFWKGCSAAVDVLKERLEMTANQVVLLAILCETGSAMSWRQVGEFLGVSRLKAMSMTDDVEDLKRRGWMMSGVARERGGRYEGFKLVYGVVTAMRLNRKFVPEKLDGLTEQAFVDRLKRYMRSEGMDDDISLDDKQRFLLQLVERNPELPLAAAVKGMGNDSTLILLLAIADYAQYGGTFQEGLSLDTILSYFTFDIDRDILGDSLEEGSHELMTAGWLEFACQDGMVDTTQYRLTARAREELLGNYKLRVGRNRGQRDTSERRDLMKASDIKEKQLFYNPQEERQLGRISHLLDAEGLKLAQDRLAESGLRRGVACLFYGGPGTGKTETVYQLARATGRDIMQVNIAGMRDKFVGESEKNIQAVFGRYRELCAHSDVTPILFFNEADAIIGARFESTRTSVEKMDNAMQNIILQEMENLDGILIATTNLTGNLDRAFDRRFLFKVEFSKPGVEARTAIWRQMMPEADADDCARLAAEFDFSGGQIENVARKCKIEYAMTGEHPSYGVMRDFCREETLNRSSRPRIGF